MPTIWIWLLLTFLLGALPWGLWIGQARGVDVTATGSGNIGATNVSRSLGFGWGITVLVLDALKVAVPTYLAWRLTVPQGPTVALEFGAATALVGTLGHIFSPFVGWKGGKGVSCLLGGTLVLSPAAAGLSLLVFVAVLAASHISSLASLAAVLSLPVILWLLGAPISLVYYGMLAFMLVMWTHRDNIRRLRRGEEPQLGRQNMAMHHNEEVPLTTRLPESAALPARPRQITGLAVVAILFGLMTIKAGGTVLFGSEAARTAAGHYVPFVLWFNFLAGFAYVAAGLGLWQMRPWASRLALVIAGSTLGVFAAFGLHILQGGAYEGRTAAAMTLRTVIWFVIALVSRRALPRNG
jgi:acyl-phosphate glycerol 3-phosphate acyltransferase